MRFLQGAQNLICALTADDRGEILDRLWSLEERDAVERGPSAEEKSLLDAELADHETSPNAGSSWAEVQARLRGRS